MTEVIDNFMVNGTKFLLLEKSLTDYSTVYDIEIFSLNLECTTVLVIHAANSDEAIETFELLKTLDIKMEV